VVRAARVVGGKVRKSGREIEEMRGREIRSIISKLVDPTMEPTTNDFNSHSLPMSVVN